MHFRQGVFATRTAAEVYSASLWEEDLQCSEEKPIPPGTAGGGHAYYLRMDEMLLCCGVFPTRTAPEVHSPSLWEEELLILFAIYCGDTRSPPGSAGLEPVEH